MKKLLITSVLFLAACQGTPTVPEPVPAVPVGFYFNTPCQIHGEDIWTVQTVERSFVYTLASMDGNVGQVDEKGLLQTLQELGISLDAK